MKGFTDIHMVHTFQKNNSSQKYVQNCYFLCPTSINERRQALGSWLKGDQVCTSVWSPSTSCPCCKSSPHQPQDSRPPPSRVKTTNLKSQVTALNQNITIWCPTFPCSGTYQVGTNPSLTPLPPGPPGLPDYLDHIEDPARLGHHYHPNQMAHDSDRSKDISRRKLVLFTFSCCESVSSLFDIQFIWCSTCPDFQLANWL